MSIPVGITGCGLWDTTGVWSGSQSLASKPPASTSQRLELAPWPEATPLAELHPRARRPTRAAVALIQLADAVFKARRGVALGLETVDILLGTEAGSSAVDIEFQEGLDTRGAPFGSPSTFVYTLATAAPAELSIALGMRCALSTVTAGASSGLLSLVRGAARIASGRSRACLCGELEMGHRVGTRERISLFLLEADAGRRLERFESGFGGHVGGSATLESLAFATARHTVFEAGEVDGSWARLELSALTQ